MSNESISAMDDVEDFTNTIVGNTTTQNLSPESIGINTDYAFKEFNMTNDDLKKCSTECVEFSICFSYITHIQYV